MISGATEVGLTAHRMDDELDTGDSCCSGPFRSDRRTPDLPGARHHRPHSRRADRIARPHRAGHRRPGRRRTSTNAPSSTSAPPGTACRLAWPAEDLERFVPTPIPIRTPSRIGGVSGSASRASVSRCRTAAPRAGCSSPRVTAWSSWRVRRPPGRRAGARRRGGSPRRRHRTRAGFLRTRWRLSDLGLSWPHWLTVLLG